MRKIIMVVLFMMLMAASGIRSEAGVEQDRATWLWNPWMIVDDESGTLAFLETKKLNKVYVQIDRDIPVSVYRSFNEKAAGKGIRVYALDGAPDWAAPKGYMNQDRLMTWLGSYQNGATSVEKFSGIHLDVEPYLYSGWNSNRAETIKSYQALLTKAKTNADTLKMEFEADIPFWFDEITYKNTYGNGILAEWVISKASSVTIMAYRDSAAMIADLVKNEVGYAAKYGKRVVAGVETGQTSEGSQITFFEEGESYMNTQLEALRSYYANNPAFGGTAVHHVGSWITIKP
ncbi:amidase [Peribacillus sp. SCS-37]|uniref:amidase n=1 Tax=Paraperibacillus esterisolvens TaxID=3115296 RepID=UPI0039066EED